MAQGIDAINNHDVDAAAALNAVDAVAYDPAYPEPLRGRDAIRQDYADFFLAFPDLHATVSQVLVSGNTVAYEMQVTGTHQGPLDTPRGTLPATNNHIELRMAVFAEVDPSGLILHERRYYDVASLLQQLGLAA